MLDVRSMNRLPRRSRRVAEPQAMTKLKIWIAPLIRFCVSGLVMPTPLSTRAIYDEMSWLPHHWIIKPRMATMNRR